MRWNDLMMKPRAGAFWGVTAMEYALPIGLVIVLAVPAMGSLGDLANGMFGGMLGTKQATAAPTEIASAEEVIGTPSQAFESGDVSTETPEEPVADTPAAPAAPPKQSVPSNVSVSFDPATGLVKYSGYDAAGNKIETTDASGTELTLYMAQMLEKLAETATKDDGTPLPNGISDLIKQLAAKGHVVSGSEKSAVTDNTIDKLNSIDLVAMYGPASARTPEQVAEIEAMYKPLTDFNNSMKEMKAVYDSLINTIGKKKGYEDVKAQIALYSGVINSVGVQNFYMTQDKNDAYGTDAFYKSYGFGAKVTTSVSVDMAPIVTYIESDNIHDTAAMVP